MVAFSVTCASKEKTSRLAIHLPLDLPYGNCSVISGFPSCLASVPRPLPCVSFQHCVAVCALRCMCPCHLFELPPELLVQWVFFLFWGGGLVPWLGIEPRPRH